MLETGKDLYIEGPRTREGAPFTATTVAKYLVGQDFIFPKEAQEIEKTTVICIDDGMVVTNPNQKIIPFSGSGVGEELEVMAQIFQGANKLKPHGHCGKAALVLSDINKAQGLDAPSQEAVDEFAENELKNLGQQLKITVGRTLSFNDERFTNLVRPKSFHPADGAIVGLSGLFLHNIMPAEEKIALPFQFRLAGHYYHQPLLLGVAVAEAKLALEIASGDQGIGIVERGFRYTGLVDVQDPSYEEKIAGFEAMVGGLRNIVQDNNHLNRVFADLVAYDIKPLPHGSDLQVSFKPLTQEQLIV